MKRELRILRIRFSGKHRLLKTIRKRIIVDIIMRRIKMVCDNDPKYKISDFTELIKSIRYDYEKQRHQLHLKQYPK